MRTKIKCNIYACRHYEKQSKSGYNCLMQKLEISGSCNENYGFYQEITCANCEVSPYYCADD